jgi:hypothetical protein
MVCDRSHMRKDDGASLSHRLEFDAGLTFNYGSYRDYWQPNLNGVLRTFNVFVGVSW